MATFTADIVEQFARFQPETRLFVNGVPVWRGSSETIAAAVFSAPRSPLSKSEFSMSEPSELDARPPARHFKGQTMNRR
jgi:hypothetical protein